MKMIGFLHTAEVHVAAFDALLAEVVLEVKARHVVDMALLDDARAHGINDAIERRVADRLGLAGARGAAVVVCTCSTIGSVAERLDGKLSFPTQRIDRAMADAAVLAGERILVVAALESTLEPTRELLQASADSVKSGQAKNLHITPHHIPNTWQHFETGNHEQYWRTIADAIRSHAVDHDVVVIAQASMAGAVQFCNDVSIPILSSPRLGVERAVAVLNSAESFH